MELYGARCRYPKRRSAERTEAQERPAAPSPQRQRTRVCVPGDQGAFERGLPWCTIQPRRPMENGYVDSLSGRSRDECLNENWFSSLADAREKIASWKQDYNERRPHSSLQYRALREFAAQSAAGFDTDDVGPGASNAGPLPPSRAASTGMWGEHSSEKPSCLCTENGRKASSCMKSWFDNCPPSRPTKTPAAIPTAASEMTSDNLRRIQSWSRRRAARRALHR